MAGWWIGGGLAVGFEPSRGLPAFGADVLPLELRAPAGDRSVAVAVDWAQLVASSALSPRATVGLAGFVEREAHGLRWGPGVEVGVGGEVRVVDGELARRTTGGVAPAVRVGVPLRAGPCVVAPALRGALGVQGVDGSAEVWARGLLELTVLGRVAR